MDHLIIQIEIDFVYAISLFFFFYGRMTHKLPGPTVASLIAYYIRFCLLNSLELCKIVQYLLPYLRE